MKDASTIEVILPKVLAEMTGGRRHFNSTGATLGETLFNLGQEVPGLMVHFFNEAGDIRRHIICLHGETYVRAAQVATWPVSDGDEIRILNALAGG